MDICRSQGTAPHARLLSEFLRHHLISKVPHFPRATHSNISGDRTYQVLQEVQSLLNFFPWCALLEATFRDSGRQISERTEHEQGMCSFVRIRCHVRLFVCQYRACSLVRSVRSHNFRFRQEVHYLALIYLVLPDISNSVNLVVLAQTNS